MAMATFSLPSVRVSSSATASTKQVRNTCRAISFSFLSKRNRFQSNQFPLLKSKVHFRNGKHLVLAELTESETDKNEAFKDAVKSGDLVQAQKLIASGGIDINSQSVARAGWTALHLGSFYEHPEIVQLLLSSGADIEARNNSGNTALQFACLKGNVPITRMLLDAGADLDAESNDKGTAMDYAQEWGGEEIVDFLLIWAAKASSQTS